MDQPQPTPPIPNPVSTPPIPPLPNQPQPKKRSRLPTLLVSYGILGIISSIFTVFGLQTFWEMLQQINLPITRSNLYILGSFLAVILVIPLLQTFIGLYLRKKQNINGELSKKQHRIAVLTFIVPFILPIVFYILFLFLVIAPVYNSINFSDPNALRAFTPYPIPTITSNPITSWKTHVDKQYAFELKYPNNWYIQPHAYENDNLYEALFIFDQKPFDQLYFVALTHEWPNMYIRINKTLHTEKELQINETVQGKTSEDGLLLNKRKYEIITFKDIKANKRTYLSPSEMENNKTTQIIFNRNGFGWVISYPNKDYMENHDEVFDQILSTFTFLDNQNSDIGNVKNACVAAEGKWLDEHNECESIPSDKGLTQDQCKSLGGSFQECASACRHNPKAEVCIGVCVKVCTFN